MVGNPRNANGHKRRQLRARVLREESFCALCGQIVDKTLNYLDPAAPEVDEILPVSLGGSPYERANVRLTHRLCNQKRSNKLDQPKPQLKTSRKW
jgi:5-methylcytosine-specific restriction endonuclease McrA